MAEPPVKNEFSDEIRFDSLFHHGLPLLDDCRYICHLFLV